MLNMDPCLVVDTFDGANALESSKNNDHCSAGAYILCVYLVRSKIHPHDR